MLYIFHNTDDGVMACETISLSEFSRWVSDHTDGIKPEYHPQFSDKFPGAESPCNQYVVIDGDIVVPQPISIVTRYSLTQRGGSR